jgi:hypothetical protein
VEAGRQSALGERGGDLVHLCQPSENAVVVAAVIATPEDAASMG